MQPFDAWLADLRAKRRRWVDASHENNFDRGIWNATVEKYADPTHFIFELLQNAEDAGATSARFALSSDRIVFEHDGEPFTRDDIKGITGIGNTTKLDQANRIGCFGIGFKSVYVVTSRPEVHGPIEGRPMAFAIDDLVVPTRIPTDHAGTATRIVLPLGPNRAEEVISAVSDTLARFGARSLLFLRGLQQLEWVSPMGKGSCSAQGESQGKRVLVTSAAGAPDRVEHYHVLERDVPHGETGEAHAVKIALRLDDDGKEVVPEEEATRLAVFFETEEPTGLRFRVHGPFQLTDNRANIKRDDPWNTQLVRELGTLLSEALPRLRDAGLVTEGLLKALPNPNDSLPGHWPLLREAAVSAFKREALVPARFAGHVAAGHGIRGPAAIRDLLRDEGLAAFGNQPGRKWAASASQRNNRADQFLSALGMPEWGQRELVSAFEEAFDETMYLFRDAAKRTTAQAWFDGLSDEDVQRFYLLVEAAARDENAILHFGMMVFVRAEDGSRACPGRVFLPPREAEPGRDANVAGLAMVRGSLLGGRRGPDVARFLRHAGVKETGEREYLQTLLSQAYGEDGAGPPAKVHLAHMRRVLQYFEQTKDASVVRGMRFLRAEGVDGYFTGHRLYLDSPFTPTGLSAVYDGRVSGRSRLPLWHGYERLPREKLLALCSALWVESALEIRQTTISQSHPMWAQLMGNWPRTRVTDTEINRDYTIDHVRALLDLGDRAISKLIWEAVSRRGREVLFASYRPNESHQLRGQHSSLALALREAKWLPARDGSFYRASELSEGDLDPAFAVAGNASWLAEIGFGAEHKRRSAARQERQRAAREMGVPDDLFDLLDGMRLEDRQDLFEKVKLLAEGARFAGPPEFPERAAPNPGRRAARVAERAAAAAAKTYEVRDRSVRTTAADPRRQADAYLRDLYTNRAGEMVCQACHQQMPFRRLDGSPYFEAPEFLKDATTEHPENRLALCPTCAAKWLHARETGPQELRAALAEAQRTSVPVRLAGEDVQIRFVEVHWDDLRAVFGEPVGTSGVTV